MVDPRKEKVPSVPKPTGSAARSVLNGIIGDYLSRRNNALAIPMEFIHHGQPLVFSQSALKETLSKRPSHKSKTGGLAKQLFIFVHGLASSDTVWEFPDEPGVSYASLLESDLRAQFLMLRYNSGLHVSENGKNLSRIMQELIDHYPGKNPEIIFIAHSMGGLVTRSACFYAKANREGWVKKVKKLIFLGSPHQGAPLEKFGNIVTGVLAMIPNPVTKMTRDVLNLRSSGIKDLRYGYGKDDDWEGKDPDALLENTKNAIPLLAGADHYVVTGTLTANPENPIAQWFGDGLVRKPSALGKSDRSELTIPFPLEHHKEFPGLDHVALCHSRLVYSQIQSWCSPQRAARHRRKA